jgi:hypothetical protein
LPGFFGDGLANRLRGTLSIAPTKREGQDAELLAIGLKKLHLILHLKLHLTSNKGAVTG